MPNPVDTAGSASEAFIGSREKAKNGYGQNGFQGPSSDTPGKHTTSGFLPKTVIPKYPTGTSADHPSFQTRTVSAEPIKPAHGMRAPGGPTSFPTSNVRRASVPINPKSFQR